MEISITREFFAELLHAEKRDLRWGILSVPVESDFMDNDIRPCVVVKKLKNYVFDILSGQFVHTKGMKVDPDAFIEKHYEGGTETFLFRGVKINKSYPLTEAEFYNVYGLRVINKFLD